ncbi:ABC transporter permease [Marmoricola sp. RAF53]|uniref:ABC transporter permease n=1 Tax=Marmoricola sp. RAF53 TaxID=3233059 RepID=UPI003F9C4E62
MLRFVLTRLLSGIALFAAASSLAFLLLNVGAGDVGRSVLGPTAPQAAVDAKNAALGLDDPVVVRYLSWVGHALSGDLGTSWFTSQPVTGTIVSRLSVTLTLVVGATLLTAVAATLLGVTAALRGGWADRVVQVVALLGYAIPGFLLALLLVRLFALDLGWFAPTGFVPFPESARGWLGTATLPIVALSVGATAAVALQVRGAILDALRQDWVRTLRSRGLSERRVVLKHVLRNAGGPALTVLGLQFIGLLGGAVIVEQIFAIPGLGQMSVTATATGDVPVVMGLVIAVGTLVVLVNLAIDLAQGVLNPKVRVR